MDKSRSEMFYSSTSVTMRFGAKIYGDGWRRLPRLAPDCTRYSQRPNVRTFPGSVRHTTESSLGQVGNGLLQCCSFRMIPVVNVTNAGMRIGMLVSVAVVTEPHTTGDILFPILPNMACQRNIIADTATIKDKSGNLCAAHIRASTDM